MASFKQSYGGKYLNSSDVPRQGIRTTIEEVVEEEIGRGADKKTKWVAWLKGVEKGWVINKSNGDILSELYGDDSNDWAGKRVVLKVGKTLFEGRKVDSIMVDEDATKAAARAASQAAPTSRKPAPALSQAEADEADEVPEVPF